MGDVTVRLTDDEARALAFLLEDQPEFESVRERLRAARQACRSHVGRELGSRCPRCGAEVQP